MDGRSPMVQDVRIALGSVAPTVVRATRTEDDLRGQTLDEARSRPPSETLASEIAPIDDIRSTARYRARVAGNLLREFLSGIEDDADAGRRAPACCPIRWRHEVGPCLGLPVAEADADFPEDAELRPGEYCAPNSPAPPVDVDGVRDSGRHERRRQRMVSGGRGRRAGIAEPRADVGADVVEFLQVEERTDVDAESDAVDSPTDDRLSTGVVREVKSGRIAKLSVACQMTPIAPGYADRDAGLARRPAARAVPATAKRKSLPPGKETAECACCEPPARLLRPLAA